MRDKWIWSYGNFDDRVKRVVQPDCPCLRYGASGLIIIMDAGRYSITHDASGKSLGFRTTKLTDAKRFVQYAAPIADWHQPTADAIKATRPTITNDLRGIHATIENGTSPQWAAHRV